MPSFDNRFKPGDPDHSQIAKWGIFALVTLAVTLFLEWLGFPSAILLGPMLIGIAFGVRGTQIKLNKPLFHFAQGIAGCLIAQNLTPQILHHAIAIWPSVVTAAAMTLVLASLVGLVFSRITVVSDRESIWGFLPGMAGTIIAMAAERGIDARVVAVIQVVRLIAVILAMSAVSSLWSGPAVTPPTSSSFGIGFFTTVAIAILGPLSSRLVPFISGIATIVPMLIGAVLQTSGLVSFHVPYWLLLISYFLIGADTGLKFTPTILREVLRYFFPLLGAVISLLMLCGLMGAILSMLLGVDLMSSLLATVPGSIDSVAIIAINSGADLSFVMTIQVVRLFTVLLIGPVLAAAICGAFPKPAKEEF